MSTVLTTTIAGIHIDCADALERYEHWTKPTVIVVDGPYGINGFRGDLVSPEGLAEWYAPHAAAWAKYALPETTLWFWGTEIGWATVHPILALHGWAYRACCLWNKGVAHIAGNVNSKTIRRFPVVSEICAQYTRDVHLWTGDGAFLPMQPWLRHEWKRSQLPLAKTNEACGVKNAATRKYFTADHLWYFPPPDMMEKIAEYANCYGKPTDFPYFSLDGKTMLTARQWEKMRAKWNHEHAVTNVWTEPAVRGTERLKSKTKAIHRNQKPLRLLERIILASSDLGDVIWEPFGGLCTTALAAMLTGRQCFSAEIDRECYWLARERILQEGREHGIIPRQA
jgi:site-specific DNA-methyltransferase (adenine-specific)